jgi:small conductance mechanosensitive channel
MVLNRAGASGLACRVATATHCGHLPELKSVAAMTEDLGALRNLVDTLVAFGVAYGFQILGALVIIAVGVWLSRACARLVMRRCEQRHFDVTLSRFFANLARTVVLVFVGIIALGKFGITISPLIAALSAVAFGSSLALAGPLSNYGAGLALILGRPFVVGDTLTVLGRSGVVEEIRLAATWLRTEDGERVIIPNKEIVGQVLVNSYANRVVELSVGVAYDEDLDRAEAVVRSALAALPEVVQDPAPQIGLEKFGDSALQLAVRYWVPTPRYFDVQFQANKAIHRALRDAGVRIPCPQQDVRLVDGRAREA